MKRNLSLILFCFLLCGCAVPRVATYAHLYSATKQAEKTKGLFSTKVVVIKDFRGNDIYDEDIDALKGKVSGYISNNPQLTDEVKKNLSEIRVTPGMTKEQVRLLLGEPDKLIKNNPASQIWVYQIKKLNVIPVFIFPVFFVHEAYFLNFEGDTLVLIERHYVESMIQTNSPDNQGFLAD